MKVYLAGEHTVKNGKGILIQPDKLYILESYVYALKNRNFPLVRAAAKDMLLDSGAYTFMRGNAESNDFEAYTRKLAEFIQQWNIDYFFELDIDKVVGLQEVERLRSILERETGKRSIPVWHRSRGLKYWERMCAEYPYVSLSASGNNGSSQWTRTTEGERIMAGLLNIAQRNGTKVHALGYTKISMLRKLPFHSVDSTAWLMGNISGGVSRFTGRDIKLIRPEGKRVANSNGLAQHNFNEWVKFQRYADQWL